MPVSHSRRSAGEGTIYTTADGRLRGALRVTHPRTGHQVRRTVSGRTRAEVARKIEALKREAADGSFAGRLSLGDFLTRWLEAEKQRIRLSTWRERELHIRLYIRPALGPVPLAKLTPLDVERMTSGVIAGGLSPRTAAHVRVSLRRALGDAVRDGLISRNVAALARPPRVPGRTLQVGRDYLDAEQLRALLTTSRLHPIGPLVTLAATTGLRAGELLGLAWPDVDTEAGTLTVRRSLARVWQRQDGETVQGWGLAEPKTPRSRRTINLPGAAVAALQRQRELQEAARGLSGLAWQNVDSLVFTDAVGRSLRGYSVNADFHKLLDAAGLPSVPLHGLRHSAATLMLAQGVPLKVVSESLGHSGIAITADTYAAVMPAQRKEAADAIDRALAEVVS